MGPVAPPPDSGGGAGGATTIDDATSAAFSTPAPNLSGERLARHLAGDVAFEQTFVSAPATQNGGLGPIFNNTSCAACHVGDGRSRGSESLLLRVSLPGAAQNGGPAPVPGFGGQIQTRAIFGFAPEAGVVVAYEERPGTFADGTPFQLRAPSYVIAAPYASFPAGALVSPRVARPVFGLGLLEAVPEEEILALAAEQAAQGISGRPNYVWDESERRVRLGRFGWKANQPSLFQQATDAYGEDMGVTSPAFATESGAGQPGHEDGLSDDPELDQGTLDATTFYVQTLAVPDRRPTAGSRTGEELFERIGCAACHVSVLRTGDLPGVPEVGNQRIEPYTDLLLHDMGEGLADGRPDFDADGREWRTPPLWGIGLSRIVTGHTEFLHDGRARDLSEAILWHGGEAEAARERFRELARSERESLLAFLESL
jgi:CxxC motif-containing protein (DUF1111 family)